MSFDLTKFANDLLARAGKPPVLPVSCATCLHFDGDHFCANTPPFIKGYIAEPADIVCVRYQPKRDGD